MRHEGSAGSNLLIEFLDLPYLSVPFCLNFEPTGYRIV